MSDWFEIQFDEILKNNLSDQSEIIPITIFIDNVLWQSAEPDIGMMHDYIDDWTEYYCIGSAEFSYPERSEFINEIADIVNEDSFVIEKLLGETINDYMQEMEQFQ